ncbi:MAG: YgfZ/GcvT domain-containing protein [Desertimonas sp.]
MTQRAPFWAVNERDVVSVHGPDALTYLHGQASQSLTDLAIGESRWTLMLEPTGKIVSLARAWRTAEDTVVLDTDAGFGDALAERLNRFRIRVKAEIDSLPWTSLVVRGADAGDGRGHVVGWWGEGRDLLGAGPTPPDDIAEGAAEDVEWARVHAGWPAMGAEIVPGATIPAETGLTAVAVDFRKGCYPGQELVERMASRGADAPRRLRRLTVAPGSASGDPIVVDGVEVGTLTSVVGADALGYVRRGVEIGEPVGPG